MYNTDIRAPRVVYIDADSIAFVLTGDKCLTERVCKEMSGISSFNHVSVNIKEGTTVSVLPLN